MKRELLLILLVVLALSACQRGGPTDTNFHSGTQGLELEYLRGFPEDEVYENEPLPIVLTVANRGAHDLPYDKMRLTFAYDPLYITGVNEHDWDAEEGAIFRGKSFYYPEGQEETLDFYNFQTRGIVGLRESPSTQILAQLCYEYETDFAEEICMDVDKFIRSGREQVCSAQDISSGSQGAPIAFTNVEVRNIPVNVNGANAFARPEFYVTIRNVGTGVVIGPPQADFAGACSVRGLSEGELNAVKVSGSVLGIDLVCNPDKVRLTDGEGITRCGIPDEELGNPALVIQQNFYTALTLKAEYIYRNSIVKELSLLRAPGSEAGFGRFTGEGATRYVPGYAYDKDGKQVLKSEAPRVGGFAVDVDAGTSMSATVKSQDDGVEVQVPAEAKGDIKVSLDALPGQTAQITSISTGADGEIIARTPKGDVKVVVESDEGTGASVIQSGNDLLVRVDSTDGGTVRVRTQASSEYTTENNVEVETETTVSTGSINLAVTPQNFDPQEYGMSYCEYLADDPSNVENSQISESVKPLVSQYINKNFGCYCSKSECNKLDDKGKCLYTLCPGSLYCCDQRSQTALKEQTPTMTPGGTEIKEQFTVHATVYFLPECNDYGRWSSTGEDVGGTQACKTSSKGFYEDVTCQGSGYCDGKSYNYQTIEPTREASKTGPVKTACGATPVAKRTIAVNNDPGTPCYLPYGTRVALDFGSGNPWNGEYVAEDTGSMINGCRIDVFAGAGNAAKNAAISKVSGKNAKVNVLEWGTGRC